MQNDVPTKPEDPVAHVVFSHPPKTAAMDPAAARPLVPVTPFSADTDPRPAR